MSGSWPAVGVGAVVVRGDQVLLIRRAKPPLQGRWSVPGGRVEAGESLEQAVCREVREETGLQVRVLELLTTFDRIERDASGRLNYHYVIVDFLCEWLSGEPRAASDAAAAEFVARGRLGEYDLPEKALEVVLDGFARDRRG